MPTLLRPSYRSVAAQRAALHRAKIKQRKAVVKIQSAYRSKVARRDLKILTHNQTLRRRLAAIPNFDYRIRRRRENSAAVKIQSALRKFLAKKKLDKAKVLKNFKEMPNPYSKRHYVQNNDVKITPYDVRALKQMLTMPTYVSRKGKAALVPNPYAKRKEDTIALKAMLSMTPYDANYGTTNTGNTYSKSSNFNFGRNT